MNMVNKGHVGALFQPEIPVALVHDRLVREAEKYGHKVAEVGAITLRKMFPDPPLFFGEATVLYTVPDPEPHIVRGDE